MGDTFAYQNFRSYRKGYPIYWMTLGFKKTSASWSNGPNMKFTRNVESCLIVSPLEMLALDLIKKQISLNVCHMHRIVPNALSASRI